MPFRVIRAALLFLLAAALGFLCAFAWRSATESRPVARERRPIVAADFPADRITGGTGADGDRAAAILAVIAGSIGGELHVESGLFAVLREFTAEDFQRLMNDPARVEELAKALGGGRAALKNPLIEGLIDHCGR